MILSCHSMFKKTKTKRFTSLIMKLKKDLGRYSKRKTKFLKFARTLNLRRK